MKTLIFINTAFFVSISLLHFYWAMGGRYGSITVLPSKPDGQLLFKPGLFSTLVVAFGLLVCASITLGNLSIFDQWIDIRYIQYGTRIIAVIFIARAIGDFRFIGFTKKIKDTTFARNDTRIYSPMSLTLGVISLIITVVKM